MMIAAVDQNIPFRHKPSVKGGIVQFRRAG
jgi:hypothetical protein